MHAIVLCLLIRKNALYVGASTHKINETIRHNIIALVNDFILKIRPTAIFLHFYFLCLQVFVSVSLPVSCGTFLLLFKQINI